MLMLQHVFINRNIHKVFLVLAIFVAVVFSSVSPAFSEQSKAEKIDKTDPVGKTLIISIPRTTWDLLERAETPAIDELISKGSIAALSVRVRTYVTSPSQAYASMASGNRAEAFGPERSTFIAPNETWEGAQANKIFATQRGGEELTSVAGLALGYELNVSANKTSFYQAKLGTLQSELAKNNRSVAVFGNADQCNNDEAGCFDRSVGFFGSDKNGILENGDISRDLLNLSRTDTTDISLDEDIVTNKVKGSLKQHDVTLVECSDLQRLESFKGSSVTEIYETEFLKALESCDQMIGEILKSVSLKDDRVYLLSPTSTSGLNQTTVFVAAGKDIPKGFATSSSTRKVGSVTIVDFAPSILNSYGIEIPKEMGKTIFDWKASDKSNTERKAKLIEMNDGALAREKAIKPVTTTLVVLSVISMLLCIIALTKTKKWNFLARFTVLACAFYPTTTYLLKPFYLKVQIPFGLIIFTVLLSTGFAAAIYFIYKKFSIEWAVLMLAIFNLAVHSIDVIFGGNLQFNSAFGHSPIVAGRFSGFSNQAFAIIAISMVLIVAMIVELNKDKTPAFRKKVNFALIAFMLAVLVIDGAPFFGSDVGGVLALTPTIIVIAVLLFEKRLSIKWLVTSGIATFVALVGFALLDLSRPVAKRSHLGRFAESVVNGDAGVTIERKLAASIRSFQSSTWVIIVIAFLLFSLFIYLRERQTFVNLWSVSPGFRIFVFAGVFVAILGMGLNDSGVSIPAMMMVISMVPLSYYLIDRRVTVEKKDNNIASK